MAAWHVNCLKGGAAARLPARARRGKADERAMDSCAEIRPELGAYLTGAICPRDRARLVRHLRSCEQCRDELASLAALPGLLRRVPADQGQASLPGIIRRPSRRWPPGAGPRGRPCLAVSSIRCSSTQRSVRGGDPLRQLLLAEPGGLEQDSLALVVKILSERVALARLRVRVLPHAPTLAASYRYPERSRASVKIIPLRHG
jgi:anti-sigma factor RsiW